MSNRIKKVSEVINEKETITVGDVPLRSDKEKDYRVGGEERYQAPHTKKPFISTHDLKDTMMIKLSEIGVSETDVEKVKETIKLISDLTNEIDRIGFKDDRRDDAKYFITNLVNFADILQHNKPLIEKLLNINLKEIRKK